MEAQRRQTTLDGHLQTAEAVGILLALCYKMKTVPTGGLKTLGNALLDSSS